MTKTTELLASQIRRALDGGQFGHSNTTAYSLASKAADALSLSPSSSVEVPVEVLAAAHDIAESPMLQKQPKLLARFILGIADGGVGHWIAVTERLPEDGAMVFVFNGEICTVANYDADPDAETWTDRIQGCAALEDNEVTHWMPLPIAPEPRCQWPACERGGEQCPNLCDRSGAFYAGTWVRSRKSRPRSTT